MALASQTARTQEVSRGSRSGYPSPRRRRNKNIAIAVIAAIVLGAGGYAAYKWGGSGKGSNQANNAPTDPKGPPRPAPATDSSETPKTNIPVPVKEEPVVPPAPKPDELTMGVPKGESPPPPTPSGAGADGVRDPLGAPASGPAGSTPSGTPAVAPPPSPAPAVVPPPSPSPAEDLPADAASAMDRAKRAMGENRLVEARSLLNGVLSNTKVKETEKEGVRSWLGEINQTLLFSPTVAANDPLSEAYKVVSGDNLENITKRRGLAIDRRLISRVNRMANPNALRVGQTLKLVRGPFHAVVHKSKFRLDLYAGTPIPPGSAGTPREDGAEDGWTFIRSFPVGLGENNGTPMGTFVVKKNSKLVNPHWVNPRTGEKFSADDPKNPIGEHWLGLTGVDEKTKAVSGYGLHGTIDPDSIGKQRSMGCVRMKSDDISLVWELLVDEVSTVRIVE